jgi:hypothetical protein
MKYFCYTLSRQIHARLQFTIMFAVLMLSYAEARPILVPRAIVRPIPMPPFKVSVIDDNGGFVPQAEASDGGGLINGRVFSAPNIIWAILASVIGAPLGVAGVKLWRITTALGIGLSLAFTCMYLLDHIR